MDGGRSIGLHDVNVQCTNGSVSSFQPKSSIAQPSLGEANITQERKEGKNHCSDEENSRCSTSSKRLTGRDSGSTKCKGKSERSAGRAGKVMLIQ